MKRTIATATSIALLVATGAFADTKVERRQQRQQARISQGIRDGQLTANEAANLRTKEAKLQTEKRRMRESHGGKLTTEDRAKLNRQQNRLSKEIDHQKHDAQHQR